ncbi:uncharacterized protein C17orf50 homolog isoform X1 [Monodelphis domestica]|uniref:uncharacterized protein C17orf50 homolog isoform X1 n=1 Tax=Monodelphis domestica TaxID=13616 RepID=UPI0004431AC6|nr:uncharacterized protein C17orf50 homolog isoform X1 [Monodelphis domestica]
MVVFPKGTQASGLSSQHLDCKGLKIPLWKKEPEELLDEDEDEDEDEEEEGSDEKDSEEIEKASEKEGEYWDSEQENQDGEGKDKGSISYCPLRQESSIPEVTALRRSESVFWTWLSPLSLLSNLAFPMDRKRIPQGQICLLEKQQQSKKCSCSRCEILFCRKCETLHCDPNYVEHCILDHWEGGEPSEPQIQSGTSRTMLGISDQEEEYEAEPKSHSQEAILLMPPQLMAEELQ